MSSFKRRTPSRQHVQPLGTRSLPGSTSTVITSTGIPSLDDILGGGLPFTCSQLILAPDVHSAYGELIQKYFISQGLVSGHEVIVVDGNPRCFVEECMWIPNATASTPVQSSIPEEEEEESSETHDDNIKIAWRYEQMKQFQTTVSSPQSDDNLCCVFDLTCRVPQATVDAMVSSKQLVLIGVPYPEGTEHPISKILSGITERLGPENAETSRLRPIRICIPALGSVQWGDITPHEICYFLHSLRATLRRRSNVCASISLPAHMCNDTWGGPGWIHKVGWLSDACISLSAFTGNPSLSAMFPKHHGFVHIHSLPSPSTLISPSDKFSTLRGLSSSGENNLAFKCMRKRFVIETLHLDVEGGVGERRTTPATTSAILDAAPHEAHAHEISQTTNGTAAVEIQVEQVRKDIAKVVVEEKVSQDSNSTGVKKTKQQKKVAFKSDGPDLYDF